MSISTYLFFLNYLCVVLNLPRQSRVMYQGSLWTVKNGVSLYVFNEAKLCAMVYNDVQMFVVAPKDQIHTPKIEDIIRIAANQVSPILYIRLYYAIIRAIFLIYS